MKHRIKDFPKNFAIHATETFFTQWVERKPSEDDLETFKFVGQEFKVVTTNAGLIDTDNPEALKKFFEEQLNQYLYATPVKPGRTIQKFIKKEIRRAKKWRSYFPDYDQNETDDKYYFIWQGWINFLKAHNDQELESSFTQESKVQLNTKLLLLYLYKREGNKLNKSKFFSKIKASTSVKETSLNNCYRSLEYYINQDDRLKDGEHDTWERYNEQLNNPMAVQEIRKALNI